MTPKQEKAFLNKLRQPVHIDYIIKYILKTDTDEGMKIIETYVNAGVIEESKISKGYYGIKNT